MYNSRTLSVKSATVTFSPGPMMVYAVTAIETKVSGGMFISVSFVADVLVQLNISLSELSEQTSYTIITPFNSSGGLHDSVNSVTDV